MNFKNILIALSIGIFSFPKIFYYKESKCSVTYSVINEWKLELKDDGVFILNYSSRDTRFKKPSVDTIIGEWKSSNDTLRLMQQRKSNIFFNNATYVLKKEGLEKVGLDAFLPDSMEVVKN